MRYQWQKCPNPDVMVLHVDQRLPESVDPFDDDDDLDEEDSHFIAELRAIDGIACVSTSGYECQVERAVLFDWQTIQAAVIERLRLRYKPNGKMVEVPAQ